MGREEQIEEREVLDSIFPDEIIGQSEEAVAIGLADFVCFRCLGRLLPSVDSTGCVWAR